MAFDMMDGISMLKDPSNGEAIHMRIGCHSGPVVAGVVGLKMPRWVPLMVLILTDPFSIQVLSLWNQRWAHREV